MKIVEPGRHELFFWIRLPIELLVVNWFLGFGLA
jgi:hypothetical protein